MVDNPLFYSTVVPLDRARHRDLKLNTGLDRFGFSAKANLVPAVLDEFVAASRRMPIVFLPGPKQPSALFLTGLRSGESAFVDGKGRWRGGYAPAYVRRYPFIIGERPEAEPVVCIDEQSALLNGKGEPLFREDGTDAQILQDNIRFINDYLVAAKRTDAFIETLQALDLLTAITIDIRRPDVERQTFHGLLVVDQTKLEALPDKAFLDLRAKAYLQPLYAHIASLANIETLSLDPKAPKQTEKK